MERRSGRIENFLRMSDHDFHFLLDCLAPSISKKDTRLRRAISAKERLIITLRFLATGNSFEDLSYTARVSPHAISQIVIDVCAAIISMLKDQIQVCTMNWNSIEKRHGQCIYTQLLVVKGTLSP